MAAKLLLKNIKQQLQFNKFNSGYDLGQCKIQAAKAEVANSMAIRIFNKNNQSTL